MALTSVVLPLPLGPTSPKICARSMPSEMPLSAFKPPKERATLSQYRLGSGAAPLSPDNLARSSLPSFAATLADLERFPKEIGRGGRSRSASRKPRQRAAHGAAPPSGSQASSPLP